MIKRNTTNPLVNKQGWQSYYQAMPEFPADLPAPLLGILVLIWQLRDKDLQKKYPLQTKQSCIEYISWCIVSGRKEYQSLKEATLFWECLNQPARLSDETYPAQDPAHGLSWLMVLAAQARPDLGINLNERIDREHLLAWYIMNGRSELDLEDIPYADWQMHYFQSPSTLSGLNCLQEIIYNNHPDLKKQFPLPQALPNYLAWFSDFLIKQESKENLNKPAQFSEQSLTETDPAHAISRLMVLINQSRMDLNKNLNHKQGRQQLLAWYLQHGRIEQGYAKTPLETWQINYFNLKAETDGLNCLQELIYQTRPDVQKAFPLPLALADYLTWFKHFITVETQLIDVLPPTPIDANAKLPYGVNIIGYVYGQLGIGEDARMAAKSLLTTDIPITLIDFPPGADASQAERSMASFVSLEPKYAINLFCLPALEQGRCFAEWGKKLFMGRYNIGYWPWELPEWPKDWQHLLSLVNEVWVSSQYIYDALSPVSQIPVRIMPMAVEKPELSPLTRKDFALPPTARLFLFVFDLNSSMARKNPKACLNAFLKAFPLQGNDSLNAEQVGLVIKIQPPKTPNPEWDALKQLQANDPRIHLIEQTLNKADLFALYNLCDCFVSLHRAEGFGRCIAEAMLLGKPVITTNFSGNLAFCSQENSFLVDSVKIKLTEQDYPYGQNQNWAEPDINHAAQYMCSLVNNPIMAKKIGDAGQKTIELFHHIKNIGNHYKSTLNQIDLSSYSDYAK